jgi:hypothetical protein
MSGFDTRMATPDDDDVEDSGIRGTGVRSQDVGSGIRELGVGSWDLGSL